MVDHLIDGGLLLCGRPDEVVEQLKAYEETGVDQVVFGVPTTSARRGPRGHRDVRHQVIPEFEPRPGPQHDRYRDSARRS